MKKKMLPLLLIALLFWNPLSWGMEWDACLKLPRVSKAQSFTGIRPETEVEIVAPSLSAKQVSEIKQVILDTDKKLGPAVLRPSKIKLVLSQTNTSFLAYGDSEIEAGYRLKYTAGDNKKDLTKHPTHSLPLVAHEYGHLLFDLNLRQRLPDVRERLLQAQSEVTEPLLQEYQGLEAQTLARQPGWEMANAKSNQILSKLIGIYETEPSRSELFSDVIAIIYSGDLDAIRKGTDFTGSEEKDRLSAQARSFKTKVKAKGWTDTQKHTLFTPTRSFLGNEVLKRPEYQKDPGLLVQRILNAIQRDLEEILANPKRLLESPEEMNVRLISHLRSELLPDPTLKDRKKH